MTTLVITKFDQVCIAAYVVELKEILLGEGTGKNGSGGLLPPAQAIGLREFFSEKTGKWFVPFINRMIAGETIDPNEIRQEYRRIFGKNMLEFKMEGERCLPKDWWTIEDQ